MAGRERGVSLRRALASVLALGAIALAPPPADADLLSRILVAGEKAAAKGGAKIASGIDGLAAHVKSLPAGKTAAIGASASQEGHWTFVNRAGERLTAASPEELKRVVGMLVPEAAAGVEGRLTIIVSEDSVFKHTGVLKDLPKGSELRVAVGAEHYPLVRRFEAGVERLYVEVKPNVIVEAAERRLFDEAVWQLERPLNTADVRVIALETGGPHTLSPAPRIDPASKRALTDTVDPTKLPAAMRAVRGQTLVVTGRTVENFLYFKRGLGSEQSVFISDLMRAAEAADVNLIVLKSPSPRQPGSRNFLWQSVEVAGLEEAMKRATVSDFLNAVASGQGQLLVKAADQGGGRISLSAVPGAGLGGGSTVGGIWSDMVSEVTGKVVTSGIEAGMRSSERQKELDGRIIPGIPSMVQLTYAGLVIIGLIGIPLALTWWRRVWPAEDRAEYGNAIGYWLARGVRGIAFVLIFLPLVAVPAALGQVALQVWAVLTLPAKALRWLGARMTPAR